MTKRVFITAIFTLSVVLFIGIIASAQTVIHVGAFPNITHSQAMVGKANGWFEKRMGPKVTIDWKSFNAGPSAIEALFAGAIDMTYIGPNPAISGYVRSNGEALRIIAGATSGGAALVVRSDSGIQKPEDFHGKKIGSPQMGNTQDVALRAWPNGQFITAHLIVRTQFLKEHPDLVKNWIRAHVELTDWINGHLPEAKKLLNQQIAKETGKALPDAVLDEAFGRLQATYDPLRGSLMNAAKSAFDAGFLGRQMPDLSSLYDLSLLNQVLAEKGKKGIQ